MKWIKKILFLFVLICNSIIASAQTDEVQMADVMRSNGKIYIVVAICLTILIGLFAYVFSLDRKLTRFERSNKE